MKTRVLSGLFTVDADTMKKVCRITERSSISDVFYGVLKLGV